VNKDAEKRIAAQLAKAMTMICVRNTLLEDLHAWPGPVNRGLARRLAGLKQEQEGQR